ncbi:MAG: hypothetical protein OXC11_06260 [Rhodospirillales bacterium]|nr:hypothetical protein [Rhodospirillales bacterium]
MVATRRKPPGRDALRAWRFLRHIAEYVAAWRAQAEAAAMPGPDSGHPAPDQPAAGPVPGQTIPVRIQTRTDLAAARLALLAWAAPGSPASPFWIQEGMTEAVVAPDAEPLAAMVADGGGSIEGLRLLDGRLVLKIEHEGRAVQLLLRDTAPFPEGAGIELRHAFGLRMPHSMRRLVDFWQVTGRAPPPPCGRWRRTTTWRS